MHEAIDHICILQNFEVLELKYTLKLKIFCYAYLHSIYTSKYFFKYLIIFRKFLKTASVNSKLDGVTTFVRFLNLIFKIGN